METGKYILRIEFINGEIINLAFDNVKDREKKRKGLCMFGASSIDIFCKNKRYFIHAIHSIEEIDEE